MNTRSVKLLNLIAVLCAAAVAVALISQHVFDMQPCAWCVLQRLVFLVIALVCGLGAWAGRHSPTAGKAAAGAVVLLSAAGVVAAWYQYTVAANMFSCAQTFADKFIAASGMDAALPWLFGIYATCMEARVELFGVEYALWGMGLFVVTGVLGVIALVQRTPRG
ncbi:disulfide bond formation protein B [Pusillimonas sp. TS35]|uniref:disulfide bond formation protein B n=1 Tax=Paracandidimonas lactea TaxID=2895524 RepID=UPI00136EECEA|nr:disulfide bond formation protein B [Paracandidimonas lactea]MYN12203.1 disulfide bond formation protein B [Pusillimonas sp. TS35]